MERIQQSLHDARAARSKLAKFPDRMAKRDKVATPSRDKAVDASVPPFVNWRMLAVVVAVSVVLIPLMVWAWNASELVHPVNLGAFEVDTHNSVATLSHTSPTPDTEALETRLAPVNARLDRLSEAIARLDDKLGRTFAAVQAMQASATTDASPTEARAAENDRSAQRTDAVVERTTVQTPQSMPEPIPEPMVESIVEPIASPSPATSTAVSTASSATWVITLASLPDKVAADRFLADMQSQGISAEQNPATVNGRQYWRMQVTGFDTVEDARAHADRLKDRLGLRDIWVSRQ